MLKPAASRSALKSRRTPDRTLSRPGYCSARVRHLRQAVKAFRMDRAATRQQQRGCHPQPFALIIGTSVAIRLNARRSTSSVSKASKRCRYRPLLRYRCSSHLRDHGDIAAASTRRRIPAGGRQAGSKMSKRLLPEIERSKPMIVTECRGRCKKMGARRVW